MGSGRQVDVPLALFSWLLPLCPPAVVGLDVEMCIYEHYYEILDLGSPLHTSAFLFDYYVDPCVRCVRLSLPDTNVKRVHYLCGDDVQLKVRPPPLPGPRQQGGPRPGRGGGAVRPHLQPAEHPLPAVPGHGPGAAPLRPPRPTCPAPFFGWRWCGCPTFVTPILRFGSLPYMSTSPPPKAPLAQYGLG